MFRVLELYRLQHSHHLHFQEGNKVLGSQRQTRCTACSDKQWVWWTQIHDCECKSNWFALLSMHAQQVFSMQGVKIHYVEKGDPEKKLMLFVHGFPEFWFSWRYQLKEFSKDYYVIAIDQRGYAESDKPANVSDYHIDKMVGDLRQFVKQLGRKTKSLSFGTSYLLPVVYHLRNLLTSKTLLSAQAYPKLYLFIVLKQDSDTCSYATTNVFSLQVVKSLF